MSIVQHPSTEHYAVLVTDLFWLSLNIQRNGVLRALKMAFKIRISRHREVYVRSEEGK